METRSTESKETLTGQTVAKAYNGKDRNAFIFGFNPQAELWNGRLAQIGFFAYVFWDFIGYSVVRDILHVVNYTH